MTDDESFQATFRLRIDRPTAWQRLTANRLDPADGRDRLWLPGFDSTATVVDADPPTQLHATKDDEPCAGTDVIVTLTDDATGTRIRVVQSRFGDRLPAPRDLMDIGWRLIAADLHTYLATGVHPGRHLRPWGDLGATTTVLDGGLGLTDVRPGGLADRIGLVDGDLLVGLCGAPITSHTDLHSALRAIDASSQPTAEWIRDGQLCGP